MAREVTVTQNFTFHAAHVLPWHPGKCARLHGHTYRAEISFRRQLNGNGIVVDFDDLTEKVGGTVIAELDHTLLNDLIPNPTAELIAIHILDAVVMLELPVTEVRLWETPESSATATR